MQYLDANDEILTWEYESIRLSYMYHGNKRWYVPDFLVKFQDGHGELWEVKPKEFVAAEKNVCKAHAAIDWCSENAVSRYVILTGDTLHEMKII